MMHIARGPTEAGPFAPQIWKHLAHRSQRVGKIVIVHCFSHCGDPRGKLVDQKAKEAAHSQARIDRIWHKDLIRVLVQQSWAKDMAAIRANRSTFLHQVLPDNHEFWKTWSMTVRILPPKQLSLSKSKASMQLRSGI